MKQKLIKEARAYRFKRFCRAGYSAFNSMNRVVNIGVVAGCVLTFAHSTASAQTASDTLARQEKLIERELDEVTVTASRVELAANQVAKLVTVITRDEIQRAPVQSIQDLLSYAAGIDVQQRGGHGVQADISIRGGSFDQTAILLNGVNLSNPQTGHYSFDIPINLNDIERIEILHGPSSLVYGASAFSGGVNIITKKYPDHKAYAKFQAGGHELFNAEAGGALRAGISTNQLSVGYSTSGGYIANSDYDIFNALWQTRLDVEKSKIDIQLGYNDKRYGANTFYSAVYPNQYDRTKSYFASVRGETGDKLKFIPTVYWNRHHDRFDLVRNTTIGQNHHRTDVYGTNLNFQYSSVLGITSLGAEFRNEGIMSSVLGKRMDEPDGKYKCEDDRTNISYALEHNVVLDRFTLTAGVLANYNTALKGDYKFYPSISTSYRLVDNLKVYGSWSKATRMPTFTDMYYTTKTHTGSPNLKPERSEAFEVGFKYSNHFMQAFITGYYMEGDNLIDWVLRREENPDDPANPIEKWHSVNHASIDKKGLEVGAKFHLNQIFACLRYPTTLQLGYTRLHQNGDNVSGEMNSNYVLNYLRDKFTAQLGHPIYKDKVYASWNFRFQKRMGSYAKYDSATKTSTPEPYKSYSVLDLQLKWNAYRNLVVNLDINNLYDTHYFDLGNIPQAGFWLMGGVSYTFR
ncbi:vitamin B12 transporter [Dysgonomonas sp. PH5-45]|uniref:TonB-dependent receptor plug domain-containing protein n=1 Tax=unclassified Dysgonomonas TaxID=2630389 RepID=UPI002475BAAF|nr:MULTISPECIES: TonB-dependent receptor [unclassified Dysgonomonas]MDH6355345.1 vitamin B12 transporter [Dysgonomonas sp. PH5-45]MDH6388243.1 vitamin B12 transporter [Dysgonomonas sp. PH5-37]